VYLLIGEDGFIYKKASVDDTDKTAVDYGYSDIIDISNPEQPLRYCDGEWEEINDEEF
jgi:hypothetical protein